MTAVDVSLQMLERCKLLTPPEVARSVRYFCGDIAKAEWPQGPYDVVLLILALDYLEDPALDVRASALLVCDLHGVC